MNACRGVLPQGELVSLGRATETSHGASPPVLRPRRASTLDSPSSTRASTSARSTHRRSSFSRSAPSWISPPIRSASVRSSTGQASARCNWSLDSRSSQKVSSSAVATQCRARPNCSCTASRSEPLRSRCRRRRRRRPPSARRCGRRPAGCSRGSCASWVLPWELWVAGQSKMPPSQDFLRWPCALRPCA